MLGSSQFFSLFCFLAILCSLSTISIAEANKTSLSFSVDLIHRDSPLSPFYNSSMNSSELIKNAALRSISRSKLFHLFMDEKESIETIIIENQLEYLMKFYIGTPPVERFAVADTGSDLIWLQCSPCENCFNQSTPLFNPNNSSTFMSLSCDSQPCSLLPDGLHGCGKSGECLYSYKYAGQSFTNGVLGIDAISFGSTTFPKSIFGCGINNNLIPAANGKVTGIVGLGAGNLSLVSQLGDKIGHKFSYCLLPFGSNSTSKMKFGSEAMIEGKGVVSTPLIIKPSSPTFYYLNLEGITVGQKKVQNDQTDHGNIIIDSGTTLTMLEPSFYNNFVTVVKEAIGVEAEQNPPRPFNFCLRYGNGMNNITFPEIVFQFTGADVPQSHGNLFVELDNNLHCLAIVPNSLQGIPPIFGNTAQINFQVEFDLEGEKVSFAPTDCTMN